MESIRYGFSTVDRAEVDGTRHPRRETGVALELCEPLPAFDPALPERSTASSSLRVMLKARASIGSRCLKTSCSNAPSSHLPGGFHQRRVVGGGIILTEHGLDGLGCYSQKMPFPWCWSMPGGARVPGAGGVGGAGSCRTAPPRCDAAHRRKKNVRGAGCSGLRGEALEKFSREGEAERWRASLVSQLGGKSSLGELSIRARQDADVRYDQRRSGRDVHPSAHKHLPVNGFRMEAHHSGGCAFVLLHKQAINAMPQSSTV